MPVRPFLITTADMSTFAHIDMRTGIEAVVFDFGGVLTLPPLDRHIENLRILCGLDRPMFERQYRLQRSEYDRGTIDSRQYWSRVVDSSGKVVEMEILRALFEGDVAGWTRINQPVLDWARHWSSRASAGSAGRGAGPCSPGSSRRNRPRC